MVGTVSACIGHKYFPTEKNGGISSSTRTVSHFVYTAGPAVALSTLTGSVHLFRSQAHMEKVFSSRTRDREYAYWSLQDQYPISFRLTPKNEMGFASRTLCPQGQSSSPHKKKGRLTTDSFFYVWTQGKIH
jgi:hypothetical protein